MKQYLKVQIANLSIWIIVAAVAIIILWFIGMIISITFNLKEFAENTSEFIFSFIAFAFVLVACAAILYVSINISIIADQKKQEMKLDETKSIFNKKFF